MTAGCLSETLAPLCRYVDFRRRLELAISELERTLAALSPERWRIEPYPLTGERGNTLLVLGEAGVFVISATYAPGHWDDIVTVNRLAAKVDARLRGYPGEVCPGIEDLPRADVARAGDVAASAAVFAPFPPVLAAAEGAHDARLWIVDCPQHLVLGDEQPGSWSGVNLAGG
jgi:hypothetical protein